MISLSYKLETAKQEIGDIVNQTQVHSSVPVLDLDIEELNFDVIKPSASEVLVAPNLKFLSVHSYDAEDSS